MTPKKAIIIVSALFLIMVLAAAFFFFNQQLNNRENQDKEKNILPGNLNQTEPLTPSQLIDQKVNKIIEEAEKNPAQSSPEKVREDIINTVNAEILNQQQNKTAEQEARDLKAAEERQRIIDQINQQIRSEETKP